ncbi:MAG: 50S ribosomal protein L30 [Flavobacteriaceae bacterium]|nr:50S ribosomal protein L30 [Flavobacteriaceae bacterium]
MNRVKIKQTRSKINRPIDQKRTLEALGLKKIGQVVEHEMTPSVEGMINKVKHLITVVK